MKRTNTFKIIFKNPNIIMKKAIGCATLWNKLNYRRRQSFFNGEINWESKELYDEFKGWIGSRTAQQVIRKNFNAWKAFLTLIKLKDKGTLPAHIKKVNPPGYWKNRDTGELKLIYIIRCDDYHINGRNIILPFKLNGRIKGKPRWNGKQKELEIIYNGKAWIAHQSVETEPINQPSGQNKAYVDIGIRCPITTIIDDIERPVAYSGNGMLSDWWYWNRKIAEHQSILKKVNDRYTSKQLRKLYRTRQLRFRNAINNIVKDFVQKCCDNGVNEIVTGDLTGIRNNGSKGKKSNAMINNFWSHKYLIDRLTCTAENYGISVKLVDERGTSSVCPRCGSDNKVRRGRLFKCKDCGLEAHRDCVGAFNIGLVHGKLSREGDSNRMMTHPEVVNEFSTSFHSNNLKKS